MKTKNLFLAAVATMTLASCMNDEFVGAENSPTVANTETDAINFAFNIPNMTRAGEYVGATAAEKLGNMFVVEGTKGSEGTNKPSDNVVFDNYLVGYTANTAGQTKSNTNNWDYVGLNATGIADRMTAATWTSLHGGSTDAKSQTIKYWDYSQDQYDFIAWSTGECEAITGAASNGKVKVTRIATGTDLSSTTAPGAFTLSAYDADDLLQCYYTDINTVTRASGNYGKPVTLTFRNMAAKVRVALYETVPGYSVKDVLFYVDEVTARGLTASDETKKATLYTTGSDKLPQSGDVLVYYPRIGSNNSSKDDYKKASVIVTPGTNKTTYEKFGALTAQYAGAEANEPAGTYYLGRTLQYATFAGDVTKSFYTAVIPNTTGYNLTLRVDYTLVSTDGSTEEIHVYGAKAVVPATYTKWLPNYAYTYIFKISDNTNGWTSKTDDTPGLFPITFDAVVTNFVDANAEQTTVTTVASPSITTYQQGHKVDVSTTPYTAYDEYSKGQKAGADVTNVKDLYVQVMNNSTATPSLVTTLSASNSLLYRITLTKDGTDYLASEAQVMDALKNRTNEWNSTDPLGRNGITLTKNTNISNTETQIVNGVDDQPIGVASGSAAKIDIDNAGVTAGYYAYVYASTVPSTDEKIYQVAANVTDATSASNYYEVVLDGTETTIDSGTAAAGYVYFVKNVDSKGSYVSYTFKQTKVGDNVAGLVGKQIPNDKASTYTPGHFYFDVYNQNDGVYAVKVFKVVN